MIILKSPDEVKKIKKSCRIVADVLKEVKKIVRPGIATIKLDNFVEKSIITRGAKPAFKGYKGYPASVCVSINDEVVHGIPSKRRLKEGDIVSLDLGVLCDGFYGDAAITLPVGQVSSIALQLIETAKISLENGIKQAVVGNRLGDISSAIQQNVEKNKFSVVRDFVGHGIGRSLHEDPQIPNFGVSGRGLLLEAGMVLAIEPMINAGSPAVYVKQDNWTAVTVDKSISAHWEHTIAITDKGAEILTIS